MVSVNIPASLLLSLRCSFCKYYLSMPPITCLEEHEQESKIACGRCFTKFGKDSGYQSIIYETIAELLVFPCSYDSDGCCEEVEWNKASDHENICKFRAFECPITTCEYIGNIDKIKQHLHDVHEDMHIYGDNPITLPNEHNEINKILAIGNDEKDIFVLFLFKTIQANGIGLFALNDMTYSTYDITLKSTENDNSITLKNNKICSYIRNITRKALLTSIDFGLIQAALKSTNVVFTISIGNCSKPPESSQTIVNAINKRFLDESKCPVCKEYMTSPIFICKGGHSFCCNCKKILPACILCSAPVENIRNFSLENVLEVSKYPCFNINDGCTFVGSMSELKNHEDACSYTRTACPFQETSYCKWYGAICHIYDHILQKHTERTWLKLGDTLYRNLNSRKYVDVHVVNFEDQYFRLCFKNSSERGQLLVSVQQMVLKPTKKPQYLFVLEFVDQSSMGRKMVINGECTKIMNLTKCFFDCLVLPYYLLEPFLTEHNLLIFKFDIKRIQANCN